MTGEEEQSTITVGEPAAKRRRVRISQTSGSSGSTRRARTALPASPSRRIANVAKSSTQHSDPPPVAAYDPLSDTISAARARYRAWQKAGGVHDATCFVCKQPGALEHCFTCRRSYHPACKPSQGLTSQPDNIPHWFCDVCVGRKWHIELPPLTPPASPETQPLGGDNDSERSASMRQTPSNEVEQPRQPLGQAQGIPNERVLIDLSQAAQIDNSNNPAPNVDARAVHTPINNSHSSSRSSPMLADTSDKSRQNANARAPTTRKSRYATLSTDIDSALRVLYCELETTAQLRDQVSNLEGQVSHLRQELGVREKELLLAKQSLYLARSSESELARLRAEALDRQSAVDEVVSLRAEKFDLEEKLKSSEAQLKDIRQILQK